MDDASKGPIPPALSPEQWANELEHRKNPSASRIERFSPPHRHRVAALSLYGQPFGFDPLMLVSIRHLIEHASKGAAVVGPMHALWDSIGYAQAAVDRIEALLPPSDEKPKP